MRICSSIFGSPAGTLVASKMRMASIHFARYWAISVLVQPDGKVAMTLRMARRWKAPCCWVQFRSLI